MSRLRLTFLRQTQSRFLLHSFILALATSLLGASLAAQQKPGTAVAFDLQRQAARIINEGRALPGVRIADAFAVLLSENALVQSR
jgi:hypothetical protein